MRVRVEVTLKQGVLDPAAVAVEKGLLRLGFSDVKSVRLGKFVELEINDASESKVKDMCEQLLANTVVEDYKISKATP